MISLTQFGLLFQFRLFDCDLKSVREPGESKTIEIQMGFSIHPSINLDFNHWLYKVCLWLLSLFTIYWWIIWINELLKCINIIEVFSSSCPDLNKFVRDCCVRRGSKIIIRRKQINRHTHKRYNSSRLLELHPIVSGVSAKQSANGSNCMRISIFEWNSVLFVQHSGFVSFNHINQ